MQKGLTTTKFKKNADLIKFMSAKAEKFDLQNQNTSAQLHKNPTAN